MSSSLSVGRAFKVKAKHVSAVLNLPLSLAQEYFSKILGYRDFDEAQRAGLVVRELASRAYLGDRIREIVPGILPNKVEQLINELNLPTRDRVIAQLREGGHLNVDFSRYFSSDGTFSEYYHQCLREVIPAFTNVYKLSTALGTFDRKEVAIPEVLASLANLSRDDADTALALLSPCYKQYSDFLPVNAAMLVLHEAGTRRSTRLFAKKSLAVFNGMLACAAAVNISAHSSSAVRYELQSYGLAIAAVQRRVGAHDVCLDIIDGIARLYPDNAQRYDRLLRGPILLEAAFAALFARRFDVVPEFLPITTDGRRVASYPVLAIEAIARAEMGDEKKATPLVDVLLCNQEIRLGLGLDESGVIPRRRPEAMPLKDDTLGLIFGADLDRLRYLDFATFTTAHALFRKRNKHMLAKLATSKLSFKTFRLFSDLRFAEKPAKRKRIFDMSSSYTPAVLRFGSACGDTYIDVVIIRCVDFVGREWAMPPQLAQVFKGNAYFEQDPARKRWLAHILSSGHVENIIDDAGFGIKTGLGPRVKYRPGADLAWDEISFEIFRETEHLERPYSRTLEFKPISDELALKLVDVYREPLVERLQ